MAWNQPPRQPMDPWATSAYPAAAPASGWPSSPPASAQYPPQAPSSQWPSTGSGAPGLTSRPPPQQASYQAPAASAWPSTNSAPQWPAGGSTTQQSWPSNTSTTSAWDQPSTVAWPTTSSAGASNGATAWGTQPVTAPPQASAWPAPSQAPTSSAAWPSAASVTAAPQWPSDPWGASTSNPNASTAAWGNTSLNQSGMSTWSTASSRPVPAQQPAAYAPFGTVPYSGNTSAMMNSSAVNTSYQSAGSFNPFDVTNDDAGFFASAPKPKPVVQAPKDNLPPPSATTQRLLRVASMLFERGLLIKADKLFIQEMVLRGDKSAEKALEQAERDGRMEEVHATIVKERKKESKGGNETDSGDEDEDQRAEAAASSFKKRPSVARKNSDDDDEQTETLTDFRRQSSAAKGGLEAPHPAAGGYTGTVPPEMSIQKGQFVGTILMRISSKKMFRKWKPVFFALDIPRLVIFENRREWEMGAAPKFVIPLHECMWIAKPTLKKTYSLIDDGRRVYYSTLKENSPSIVAQAVMAGMEKPTNFSPALDSRVVSKFGSHYPDEINAFAHAIYSVVLVHQKDVKASLGGSGAARQDSFRGGRRS